MALPPPAGRRGPRNGLRPLSKPLSKSPAAAPLDEERLRIDRDLEELRRKEAELLRLQQQKQHEMEELPRKIAERERKQQDMIRMRAVLTATDDVFGRPRDKRHAPLRRSGPKRMTRPEQRAARMQLLLLCGVLAVILMFLWKSIH
jgi:hypothetical protein